MQCSTTFLAPPPSPPPRVYSLYTQMWVTLICNVNPLFSFGDSNKLKGDKKMNLLRLVRYFFAFLLVTLTKLKIGKRSVLRLQPLFLSFFKYFVLFFFKLFLFVLIFCYFNSPRGRFNSHGFVRRY